MGSPWGESGRESNETQHHVTLTRDFLILSTEVTQAEFERRMGYNPSHFQDPSYPVCPDCPVEMVSWHEAAAYCNTLSDEAGLDRCFECWGSGTSVSCGPTGADPYGAPYVCRGYRLPTEAEWEYAARAGTMAATYNGDLDATRLACESPNAVLDPIGWYCGNSGDRTREVGSLDPNPWGLFDMLGNVWEWCYEFLHGYPGVPVVDPDGPHVGMYSARVGRGGCWLEEARVLRSAMRGWLPPADRGDYLGFRVARSLEP
jgi:formylglycine-generating enzyme required for sulfatase activity